MTYDLTPLFRDAIGFDRRARLVETAAQSAGRTAYPPYNIEKAGDDSYVLTMAVAGFGPDDIELTVQDNSLMVTGRVVGAGSGDRQVLYRGIAARAFERRFALADHVQVEHADLANGLLQIGVKRVVPEALKPRRISIGGAVSSAAPLAGPANDGVAAADDKAA